MNPSKLDESARFTLNGSSFRFTGAVGANQLKSTEITNALKDLKENYEQLESNIVENTKKQRLD